MLGYAAGSGAVIDTQGSEYTNAMNIEMRRAAEGVRLYTVGRR